jgi:diguanylate cyclase (GGDEF)-like protein
MTQKSIAVYGDFNCPFCYALSEILLDADLSSVFQWRTIEHMPSVSAGSFTPKEQTLLTTEVYNVRHRVPDLDIAIPPCRPNTALANRLLLIVSQRNSEKTLLLRRQIYRALWVDGRDISDINILFSLLSTVDFDGLIDREELEVDSSLLQAWQRSWEADKFEGRLPILIDGDRTLMGLACLPDIQRFLGGGTVDTESAFTCYVKPRQSIAVVGELRPLWSFVETLRHQYHIHLLNSEVALRELIRTDQLPDLVLIDVDSVRGQGLPLSESLKKDELTRPIPIMLVADTINNDDEVRAYRIGVADYMRRDRSPEVFKARVDMLLQLKMTRDELDRAARLDSLTQIYNRREFDRAMTQEWRRCARSRVPLSLLMIDIDYFKKYNDHYGHLAGDGCIRMLAQTMKEGVDRTADLVCRYGGEEFGILLPDTSVEGAFKVAQNVQQRINALQIPHETSDVSDYVTVSIGCFTMLPTQDGDMIALIAGADERLYRAKNSGRNKIVGG